MLPRSSSPRSSSFGMALGLAFAGLAQAAGAPQALTVSAPWARATPPGATAGAAYAVFRNDGDAPRRVVGAETEVAASAAIHTMKHEHGMMQMRESDGLVVPAHGSAALVPGGDHLMLTGLKQPLVAGTHLRLSFVLDDGTRLAADVPVRDDAP